MPLTPDELKNLTKVLKAFNKFSFYRQLQHLYDCEPLEMCFILLNQPVVFHRAVKSDTRLKRRLQDISLDNTERQKIDELKREDHIHVRMPPPGS